jgi:hypothetical protein
MIDPIDEFRIFARETFEWANGVDIFIFNKDRILSEVKFEDFPTMTMMPRSNFFMNKENTQKLMDQLWNAGYRPSGIKNKDIAMGAMDKHIEDLRRIAFKLLKIEGNSK